MTQQDLPRLLTMQEAADVLTISERSLRRLVANGDIPHRRLGSLIRFSVEDVQAILDGARHGTGGR